MAAIDYFVAIPPEPGRGQCRVNQFGWAGSLGLSEEDEAQFRHALKLRDEQSLTVAADYLQDNGWQVTWAWVGVHGD